METIAVKNRVIEAFYKIITDLNIEEVEDLKDALSIREFELTDDGERISFEELEKELEDER